MFESLLIMIAVFASFMLMVFIAIAKTVVGLFVGVAHSFAEIVMSLFLDILLWLKNLFDPAAEIFIVFAL